jgi:hypothetical protein
MFGLGLGIGSFLSSVRSTQQSSVRFMSCSGADLLGIAAATKAHPQFNPSFSEIVDFSAVTGGNVSTFALRSLAQRPSIYDRASKHIVIAPQSHVFGLSRMFQVFAENTRPKMAIVHTLNEARNYLALQ